MEAMFKFETEELVERIAKKVIQAIKPLFKNNQQEDKVFTVKTLAGYLGVSEEFIRDLVHMNEIPHIKLGKKLIRFRKAEIDHYLDNLLAPAMATSPKVVKLAKNHRKSRVAC